jgi:cardiolipin synthase (CMP-forming)
VVKHLPNLLSASRLVAAPYIFRLLYTGEYKTALIWFAIIGATDGADGYLARRFDAQSRLGAMLDPVADKVLLSGSFLVLALNGMIPIWLAVLVLGRDALILLFVLGALAFSSIRREFPPSLAGKLSTALQILYVLAVTASGADLFPSSVAGLLQWVVALVTAWSGMDYAKKALLPRP